MQLGITRKRERGRGLGSVKKRVMGGGGGGIEKESDGGGGRERVRSGYLVCDS